MIAIQVSLYPLEQNDIKKSLDIFWKILKEDKLSYKITPLSTVIWGEDEDMLYGTVFKAYKKAREEGHAVMVTTLTTGNREKIEELLKYKDDNKST